MVYKKIEYREFNSLEEIVRWEELNLDKKYKAIRGDLIYSHDPTAQAILQYVPTSFHCHHIITHKRPMRRILVPQIH